MTQMFAIQMIVVALAAGLAFIAIQARQAAWRKTLALILCAGLIAAGFASMVQLLGRPKPVSFAQLSGTGHKLTVAASLMRENQAIYLWLLEGARPEPTAYVLPWSRKTARRL